MTRERSARLLAVLALAGSVIGTAAIAREQARPGVRGGPEAAAWQLTLFCSLEDDACGRLVRVIGRLIDERPGEVAAVFRHLAPPEHARSASAYRTAVAAARQGKGWEVLTTLFANGETLGETSLEALATVFALDGPRLVADAADPLLDQVLEADAAEAGRLGVSAVPALFLNGRPVERVTTYDALLALLK